MRRTGRDKPMPHRRGRLLVYLYVGGMSVKVVTMGIGVGGAKMSLNEGISGVWLPPQREAFRKPDVGTRTPSCAAKTCRVLRDKSCAGISVRVRTQRESRV